MISDPIAQGQWLRASRSREAGLCWAGGTGTLRLQGRELDWLPARVFLLHPGQHRQVVRPPGTLYLVVFEEWVLRQFLAERPKALGLALFQPLAAHHYTDIPQSLIPVLLALTRAMEQLQDQHGWQAKASLLYALFDQLLLAGLSSGQAGPGEAEILGRLYRLVRRNYPEQREASFYARELGVGVRKLNKLLGRITGEGVTALVMGELLAESERLLIYTDRPVRQISWELGFGSPAHFSTFFRRRKGVGPNAFRKKMR